MPTLTTDPDIIHQKAFVVRKRTKTREPIYWLVVQWQDEHKNLTMARVDIIGLKDMEFESLRFVLDYCNKGIQAVGYAEELNERVNGNRR